MMQFQFFMILIYHCITLSAPNSIRNRRDPELGSNQLENDSTSSYRGCISSSGSNMAFHKESMRCYEIGTTGPCGKNMKFYGTVWPTPNSGDCFCDRGRPVVYNSSTKKCHVLFEQDYCLTGYWLELNEFSNLECSINPCGNERSRDDYVLLKGNCAKLGDECNGSSGVVGFKSGSFEAHCIPNGAMESITSLSSCPNGTTWRSSTGQCQMLEADFRKVALMLTNDYRIQHQALPLTQDEKIDKIAQAYAEKLAASNGFSHSMDKRFGENLYQYIGPMNMMSPSDFVTQAVQAWYDEIKDYNYHIPLFMKETAHFTQLIWKSSERQGVGFAWNPESNVGVVVVNYYPPGNWEGEFFENVRRSLNGTEDEFEGAALDEAIFYIYKK